MGLINNFKNSQKEKAKGKAKKTAKRTIMMALKPILLILLKLLIPLLIGVTVLDWVAELFTARDTPQKIYDYLEIEDVAELVQIKGDETNGYYLDFVDNADDKLEDLVAEINSKAGTHKLPENNTDFLKKMIKAELYTQFPDLGGTVPASSTDGFQGAVKIRRVTPNKDIGEMKNTGKGETSSLEQESAMDTVEITDRNDQNRISSWSEGEQLYVVTRTPMYEELRNTGYWQEKYDDNGKKIYVEKDERVTYTGKYELDENALTGNTTVYVEVKKQDGTVGFVKLISVFAVDESKNTVTSNTSNENTITEDTIKSWSSGKELRLLEDVLMLQAEAGDIVTYAGDYETERNDLTGDTTIYLNVKNGNLSGRVELTKIEEVSNESSRLTNEENRTKVDVTSRAGSNNSNNIIGKEGEEYVVAIAAGHNNTNDTGAVSGDLVEEELTIKVAEKVEDLLDDYSNIEVVQTGSTSSNPGGIQVGDRTKLARNADPDLCIQIHFNSGGGTGVEVIYKEEDGISQQLAEILSNTISTSMGLTNRQAGPDTEKCAVGSLGIIESAGITGFPSVVTEGGFLDGDPDADIISGDGIDKYAEGIVEGIDEYFKADHSGYTATAVNDATYTNSVESRIISMHYVAPETLQGYIDNGDTENALKSYTLDEERNLVTVTWSVKEDGSVELKSSNSMNLKTALQKYMMPFEYLLYFYIDTDYAGFSTDLADKVMESEIVIAVQDTVTTTRTDTTPQRKTVATEPEFSTDWADQTTTTTITENVSTRVDLTYVSTWCVKTYQENSYSEAVIGLGDNEEKIVDVPGKVTDTSTTSWSGETIVDSGSAPTGEKDEDGNDIMYEYDIYERIRTEVRTITNTYESGDFKTEGKENVFVKLYNEHNMKSKVRTSGYLFSIIENNERTANLLNLTKYLIYRATDIPFGVLEYDFSEFSLESFSSMSGLYGGSIQEKVWWAVIDAGYSKEAAAGVLGNIEAESGFNAGTVEASTGAGFGLCQWTEGRRSALESYAISKGVDPSDENTQIEFLIGEITPGGGANGFATYALSTYKGYSPDDWKNATTPEDAAIAFCWIFERPGIPRMSIRTEAARRYYDQFKDLEKPTGGATALTQAADTVARYLFDNNYTYRNTGSANYTFPIANNGLRTLSCSSFIQECLLQAGYSQAAGAEKLWARTNSSLSINDFRSMGINVELITDMNALQPGDIVQYTTGYHVVMVYSVSGSNVQVKGVPEVMNPAVEPMANGYDGATRTVGFLQSKGCYALRITN